MAKRALLWLAAVRTIAALVALVLLPVLYQHDFLVLVALRPPGHSPAWCHPRPAAHFTDHTGGG
jgi:hypothetical protein